MHSGRLSGLGGTSQFDGSCCADSELMRSVSQFSRPAVDNLLCTHMDVYGTFIRDAANSSVAYWRKCGALIVWVSLVLRYIKQNLIFSPDVGTSVCTGV